MTTSTTPRVTNVSNPAAWGAEWTAESGTRFQLVSARGTTTVRLGMKTPTAVRWSTTEVSRPERFGELPVANFRAWTALVNAFVAGEDRP